MIKYVFALILVACMTNPSQAQKINYSSDKKYQKIRLGVKYPTITKKSENKESENVAFVQMPLATTKQITYAALISEKK